MPLKDELVLKSCRCYMLLLPLPLLLLLVRLNLLVLFPGALPLASAGVGGYSKPQKDTKDRKVKSYSAFNMLNYIFFLGGCYTPIPSGAREQSLQPADCQLRDAGATPRMRGHGKGPHSSYKVMWCSTSVHRS